MTTKKGNTKKTDAEESHEVKKAQGAHKADYSWNSFALTREETRELADAIFNDMTSATEEILLALLALVNSFTYTRDHSQREYMRTEVKIALMPYLRAANEAADGGAVEAYLRAVGIGGAE